MSMWIMPFIFVVGIVVWISIISARKSSQASALATGKDQDVPEVIVDHPYVLNPIFWIILIVVAFTAIVIFYYAALYPW